MEEIPGTDAPAAEEYEVEEDGKDAPSLVLPDEDERDAALHEGIRSEELAWEGASTARRSTGSRSRSPRASSTRARTRSTARAAS